MLGIACESLHTITVKISLSLAINPYDHVRDLLDGAVRVEGIDLLPLELPIEEIFFRFTKFREWHASEMSFGKVVSLLSQPDPGIIAIPVFLSRVFRHSAIYLRQDSGIRKPKDLEGRRVGIPEWAQTAGIYVRGLLQHEYGVDLARIAWHQAGVRQPGRIEKVELKLAQGVTIKPVPERSLTQMLAAGELDAVISAREVPGERLFPDFRNAESEYFRKTRIYPIMHVVVLRRDVYERDRWIAMNLYRAFYEAKQRSLERVSEFGLSHLPLPWVPDHAAQWRALAGDDFWPYGVEPNRPTLEAFVQYAHEQGVCHRKLSVDEMFAPETRESFKI
jgi:4,5-dihydroxyphthalate decarboxylase